MIKTNTEETIDNSEPILQDMGKDIELITVCEEACLSDEKIIDNINALKIVYPEHKVWVILRGIQTIFILIKKQK